jgi:hypothetical protein
MKTAFTSGQLAKFIGTLEQEGVTFDHFQIFLESGVAGDLFDSTANLNDRAAICKALGVNPEKRGMLFFSISYPLNLQQLFEASDCYCPRDEMNIGLADVPEDRLPGVETVRRFEAKIFDFPRNTSRRNAIRRIRSAGWTPAGHEHLLALMAKYPMGSKPINPVSGRKLIAPARPATIAATLAGMDGCNRAMWEYIGDDGHYGPHSKMSYLGVQQLDD